MPQEIEYSAKFDFDDDVVESWKVSKDGAVDEWVWLSSLGGKTLTTSSVSAADVITSTNNLTEASLTYGNHPIQFRSESDSTPTYYDVDWRLDANTYIHCRPNNTACQGRNFEFLAPFGGGYTYQYQSGEQNYGVNFMVMVNHATMQARCIFLCWAHWSGNPMSLWKYMSDASNASGMYLALSKFM